MAQTAIKKGSPVVIIDDDSTHFGLPGTVTTRPRYATGAGLGRVCRVAYMNRAGNKLEPQFALANLVHAADADMPVINARAAKLLQQREEWQAAYRAEREADGLEKYNAVRFGAPLGFEARNFEGYPEYNEVGTGSTWVMVYHRIDTATNTPKVEVNWSGCGSQTPETAKTFANTVLDAVAYAQTRRSSLERQCGLRVEVDHNLGLVSLLRQEA